MLQLGQHQPVSLSDRFLSPACGNTDASTAVPAAVNGVACDGACDEDEDDDTTTVIVLARSLVACPILGLVVSVFEESPTNRHIARLFLEVSPLT